MNNKKCFIGKIINKNHKFFDCKVIIWNETNSMYDVVIKGVSKPIIDRLIFSSSNKLIGVSGHEYNMQIKKSSIKKTTKTINYNPNNYMNIAGNLLSLFSGQTKQVILNKINKLDLENMSITKLKYTLNKLLINK